MFRVQALKRWQLTYPFGPPGCLDNGDFFAGKAVKGINKPVDLSVHVRKSKYKAQAQFPNYYRSPFSNKL